MLSKTLFLEESAVYARKIGQIASAATAFTLFCVVVPGVFAESRVADAVQNRDGASVQDLLKKHADVNGIQPDGMTALIWAAHYDDLEAAKILVKAGAGANASNRYGVSAISEAATIGDAALVEILLAAGANANFTLPEGDTALLLASRSGSAAAVKALLDHGANVNAKEFWHGETALSAAAGENHPDVVKLLVDHGADVNAQGKKLDYPLIVKQDVMSLPPVGGLTPLMEAARNNAYESAQVLIKAGADLNLKTSEKMTALLVAITNAHYDVAKLLIDSGADVNDGSVAQTEEARNSKNTLSRPSSLGPHAVSSMEVMTDLIAHHAKADSVSTGDVPTRSGGPGRGGDVPALSRAAKSGDLEVIKILLDAGADVKISAKDGSSAIIAAVGNANGRGGGGGFGIASKEASQADRIKAVQMLLDHGADINTVDRQGMTALHTAAGAGSDEIVQFLADHGAKVDLKDKKDRTAMDVANGVPGPAPPAGGIARDPEVHKTTVALLRKLMGLPEDPALLADADKKPDAPDSKATVVPAAVAGNQ